MSKKTNPANDPRMPALTLQRPWAALVAEGFKDVENRGFRPGDWLLGRLLAVHAGKTYDQGALDVEDEEIREARQRALIRLEMENETGIIGAVRVIGWVDVRHRGDPFLGEKARHCGRILDHGTARPLSASEIETIKEERKVWGEGNAVWWLLQGAHTIRTPIPRRGMPGIFRLSTVQRTVFNRRLMRGGWPGEES